MALGDWDGAAFDRWLTTEPNDPPDHDEVDVDRSDEGDGDDHHEDEPYDDRLFKGSAIEAYDIAGDR